jgi:hypothetical protein
MRYIQDIALLIFVALVLSLWLTWEASGQPRQPRRDIYDGRGNYKGYVDRSPYSGRCCVIYDKRGRERGVVRERQERD